MNKSKGKKFFSNRNNNMVKELFVTFRASVHNPRTKYHDEPSLKLSPAQGKDDGEQRNEFELLLAQVQGHDSQL